MARAQAQAKTETLPRIDPDEDFSDVDGDPNHEFALDETTVDPERHYVWMHNNKDDIANYRGSSLGYRVEHAEDGGVRPKMSAEYEPGEVISKRDHVLMSCSKAMWDKLTRFQAKKTRETNRAMFKKMSRTVTRLEARE